MNKGKFFAASVAAVVLLCSQALAADDWKTKRNIDVGFTIESFENNAGTDTIDGTLPGVQVSIGHLSPMYLNFSGHYSFGSLDSKFTDLYSNSYDNDSDDYVLELRGLIGLDIAKEDRDRNVALYSGLGYWRFNNEVNDTALPDFKRTVNILYLPLGIDVAQSLEGGRKCGLQAELDVPLTAKTNTETDGHPDITFTHDNGYGARFSLFYELPMSQKSTVSIEPYVTYWDLKASKMKNNQQAGANDTTELGLAVSFSW